MVLERLAELDGRHVTQVGFSFLYQILDHENYLGCLTQESGRLMTLPLA
jgi:hypothetical protein